MKLSKMLLFFAVFVFAFHPPFTSADSGLPENKYPGLTLAEARCPESARDEDYWYIIPGFSNTFGCFGRRNLPANLRKFEEVENACREKYKDAIPARFRTDYNYGHYGDLTENAIIGASFTGDDNETKISSGVSAVYLYNGQVEYVNLETLSADPSGKYILCMTPPYPRFMHSYYNKPLPLQPNLSEYTCEGDEWDLKSFCDGTPFCYKKVQIPEFPQKFRNMVAEFNVCGMEEPNSFVASVHCQEEYNYMKSTYTTKNAIQIGLHVPARGPWNKADSWQNTDGTPIDFAPWQLWEPNNGYDERNVYFGNDMDLIDFNGGHGALGGYTKHVLCKKAAVKTDLSKEVNYYDVFKVKGKMCRFERATHWNHQCPTNSSLWQIIPSDEGVHCYALVAAPVPLSYDNFKHEICHSLLPQAKLASIHYDRQFGFLYPLTNFDRANNVIVGLVRNNQSFKWSDDGTPVNTGFWAPSEPSVDPTNAVVRIHITNKRAPASTIDRPLFKTMRFEDVKADMKVACKIKAEPLIPCLPVPDSAKLSLNNAICPAGWTKQRFCDKVFCYQQVSVEHEDKTFAEIVENDYCNARYPGSHLASIHCVEEHFFVQNYAAKTLIGLHIPTKFHRDAFDVKNFEWTDGTPVDFVGWNRFSNPETSDEQYAPLFSTEVNKNIKFSQVYNKFDDTKSGWSNQFSGFENVLCKTEATAKQDN